MPRNWSESEIAAIVEDYFEMLALELEGRRYNKTEHRRALMHTIERNHGSIERKHMNISAVLAVLGLPYINGYKPYSNFQQALFEAVQARLHDDAVLYASLTGEAAAVGEPLPEFRIDTEQIVDPERVYVDAPLPLEVTDPQLPADISRIVRKFEPPAERDARNRMLGKAGEEFVFELERKRLSMLGRQDLADNVRWVARDDGDGFGFDILSFHGSGTGYKASRERWLEIKTTNGPKTTPFFITRNELSVSEENPEIFRVVRLYDFRRRARAYRLEPPLEDRVRLTPAIYRAYP
ncbi:MAG: DUF3883 domain-containing protein [Gemmatimonadetes bacterium]|nr:DUF3883 domain-containing protein [Gemmatimonadota bacterium]MYG84277.1 DUF3883 domain-containing protein [Gemmatimonadota bacterium]MYJ88856.1 DUF3883 domain-containing protein [Gemmatimonadota bacterium]